MNRQPTRLDDVWSLPPGPEVRRAIDFHGAELARWLKRAGAEPRLALILCAGKGARHRLLAGLAAQDVQVERVHSTAERPLPTAVLDHRGDHFNDKLFLIDGFEATRPEAQFAVLEGQRGMLRRTATWVAILVESLTALDRLYAAAPGLTQSFMRRFVVLAAGAPDTPEAVDPGRLLAWRRQHRVPELVFHAALAPSAAPDYDDFTRLVQSGYVNDHVARPGHPDFSRLVSLWAAGEGRAATAAPWLERAPGPALASALVRRIERFTPAQAATLAGSLEHDPLGAVRLASAGSLAMRPGLVAALPSGWMADLAKVRGAISAEEVEGVGPERARLAAQADFCAAPVAVSIWLSLAAAAAAEGDLDAVLAAVAAAAALAPEVPPELAFEVAEKQVALLTFAHDRSGARAALDELERLAILLASPLFSARHLHAHGGHLAALDPRRAALALDDAAVLFAGHGYPEQAAQAGAEAAACRAGSGATAAGDPATHTEATR